MNTQLILDKIKQTTDYGNAGRLLTDVLNEVESAKVPPEELKTIKVFVLDEMKKTAGVILKTADYKLKDAVLGYADKLVVLFSFVVAEEKVLSDENFETVKTLTDILTESTKLETAVKNLFTAQTVGKESTVTVLNLFKNEPDEYRRGKLLAGLLSFRDKLGSFDKDAKTEIGNYLNAEIEKYLRNKDALSKDGLNNLETAADICKYFADAKTKSLLKELLKMKSGRLLYYAIETLLTLGEPVTAEAVSEAAKDLLYADLTHSLLIRYKLTSLFPKELANPEYLAKSDMLYWLTAELGKQPAAIEPLGKVKKDGGVYHIFKYKSDAAALPDAAKNQWLIGWVDKDVWTFSQFDTLARFEDKKIKKTLNNIKKII